MSRLFGFVSGNKDEKSKDGEAEDRDSVSKMERYMKSTYNTIKRKYKENKLSGSIYVGSSLGMFSCSLNGDVAESDECESETNDIEEDAESKEKTTRIQQMTIKSIDKIIQNLIHRSKTWKNSDERPNISLTSGLSIGDPFLGAFSISISLTATLSSLLNLQE